MRHVPLRSPFLYFLCFLSSLAIFVHAQHIDVNPAIHAATIGEGPVPQLRPDPTEEIRRPVPEPEPESPPAEEEAPTTKTEEETPKESNNPWIFPSPDSPTEELKAGHLYNFTWKPNTEGLISLELWKIEDGSPQPKYLLGNNMENTGVWKWDIHINFPHGAGFTIVIVPAKDRNLASLSPFFTIVGDQDYESILPPPAPERDPNAGVDWSEIEVNHDGNAWKMAYAIAGGFVACNAFLFLASWARGGRGNFLGLRRGYEMLEKENGRKRVFHARSISARV